MVKVVFTDKFERALKKLDNSTKQKTRKQISKIISNPSIGKPLRFDLKGERTVYVKPPRLIYTLEENILYLLRIEHRKSVY